MQSEEDARNVELFVHGAKLVVDGVPLDTEFGVDFRAWRVGERFRGVKMLPPGLHLVYFSPVKSGDQPGARSGIFVTLQARQVHHLVWSTEREELIADDSVVFSDSTLRELEPSMGAYPLDEVHPVWQALSRLIAPRVLELLLPPSGRVSGMPPEDAGAPASTDASLAEAPTPSDVRWSAFDLKRSFPKGAPPAQVTQYSLDKSWLLRQLATRFDRPEHLLGELQLAFVCFLVVQMYDGFEQWKALFVLFCSCVEQMGQTPQLFVSFVDVVRVHLSLMPVDLLPPDAVADNFISHSLAALLRNARTAAAPARLREACQELCTLAESRFGVVVLPSSDRAAAAADDDEPETGEDAPVVVEL